jgi:hypothetical protein
MRNIKYKDEMDLIYMLTDLNRKLMIKSSNKNPTKTGVNSVSPKDKKFLLH